MTFKTKIRPRFHELDPYAMVHHSAYFCWFEEARFRFLQEQGCDVDALSRQGIHLVLTKAETRFVRSVRAPAEVWVDCTPIGATLAKLTLRQRVTDVVTHELMVEATIEVAATQAGRLLLNIPETIRQYFQTEENQYA